VRVLLPSMLWQRGGGAPRKERKPRAVAAKKEAKRGPYKKRKTKTRALALREMQPAAAVPATAPTFRCGIFSDGSLALERKGKIFKMREAEVRVLLGYIEKVLPKGVPRE
jgi:hypothetical protein